MQLNDETVLTRAKKTIEKVYLLNDIPWLIGYSGGKDSTCTTQLVINTLIEMKEKGLKLSKKLYIISADTMVETPMISNIISTTINEINTLAKDKNLPISAHIIRPSYNQSFWANLIGRGYPSPNQTFRWCTDRMKINPANDFIKKIVNKYGEAVMILGVRDGESNSRDRVLSSHTIDGYDLMRHTTMPNAYVFAPIREFSVDDVWDYILNKKNPWGGKNSDLKELYDTSEEEVTMMLTQEDKKKATTGNSRFGCWVCTVVSEDKSLTGFINSGVEWLRPLLEYRNWLYETRDEQTMRMKRRTNGSIYFSKIKSIDDKKLIIPGKGKKQQITINNIDDKWIDNDNNTWNVFTGSDGEKQARKYISNNNINLSDGTNPRIIIKQIDDIYYQLGTGPFTLEARKEMLRRLLILQKNVPNDFVLIHKEELSEIRKLWLKSGEWNDSVSDIYYEVFNEELEDISDDIVLFDNEDLLALKKISNKLDFDYNYFIEILKLEKEYFGYNNRIEFNKKLTKKLSQEFMFLESKEISNENK